MENTDDTYSKSLKQSLECPQWKRWDTHLANIILTNSSQFTCPSPSISASRIISFTSSSVSFSPRFVITWRSQTSKRIKVLSTNKIYDTGVPLESLERQRSMEKQLMMVSPLLQDIQHHQTLKRGQEAHLRSRYKTVLILVKHFECFLKFFLRISVLQILKLHALEKLEQMDAEVICFHVHAHDAKREVSYGCAKTCAHNKTPNSWYKKFKNVNNKIK